MSARSRIAVHVERTRHGLAEMLESSAGREKQLLPMAPQPKEYRTIAGSTAGWLH